MSDYRIVQCFGTRIRPKETPKSCRNRYLWIASGASKTRFGRNGSQCCPNCGSAPDFQHPYNRFLDGELTEAEAKELVKEYKTPAWLTAHLPKTPNIER